MTDKNTERVFSDMTEPDDRHKDTGEKSDTVMKESAYKTKDIGSLDTVKTQGADKEPVHAESKEPESEAGRESARIVNKESKSGADTELAHSESKEPVSRVGSDSTQSVSKESASGIIPGQASNEDVGSPQAEGSEAVPDAPPKKKKKKKKVKKKKIKKKKLPPKVIVAENLGVRFRIQEQKVDSLKEYFVRLIKRKLNYRDFWALREVNLKIRKGDRVGILGLNGAGKSTLLKCIAGVLKPTEGTVTVKGNIVPLLELGAGFDKDYTGAENIYFYGSMLGYSRSFIKERFKEIVDFSELGSFINVPVKNYSSGMKARLGFSIATVVDPEILILDEVLSVGDAKFRKKSAKKLSKMMKQGVTVLFVSHSTDQVLANCNKAIILEQGHVVASGKAEKICAKYEKMLADGSD